MASDIYLANKVLEKEGVDLTDRLTIFQKQ